MTRTQVFSWFFFGIFLLIIHLFYEIRKPFIFSLLWAGILALVLYPLHECLTRVLKYTGGGISSIILTTSTAFVVMLLLSIAVTTLAVEMLDVYRGI
jgi:predicted PurR-regulated permease PerM